MMAWSKIGTIQGPAGPPGPPGEPGPPGAGSSLPESTEDGLLLVSDSTAEGDARWTNEDISLRVPVFLPDVSDPIPTDISTMQSLLTLSPDEWSWAGPVTWHPEDGGYWEVGPDNFAYLAWTPQLNMQTTTTAHTIQFAWEASAATGNLDVPMIYTLPADYSSAGMWHGIANPSQPEVGGVVGARETWAHLGPGVGDWDENVDPDYEPLWLVELPAGIKLRAITLWEGDRTDLTPDMSLLPRGTQPPAFSSYGHTEGYTNVSTGFAAHAEGQGNEATGDRSHAEGLSTKSIGEGSHAEGYGARAEGSYSHAEGSTSSSVGSGSHAEGAITRAEGSYSHTEGYLTKTTSTGYGAHAEGMSSQAAASGSHAEGHYAVARQFGSHARGGFVWDNTPVTPGGFDLVKGHGQSQYVANQTYAGTNSPFAAPMPILLAPERAAALEGVVIGRKTDGTAAAVWKVSALVLVDASGNTTVVGATSTQTHTYGTVTGWAVTVAAGDSGESTVNVNVLGTADVFVHWSANIETQEVY